MTNKTTFDINRFPNKTKKFHLALLNLTKLLFQILDQNHC